MRITMKVGFGVADEDGKWWVEVTTEPDDGSDPLMVGPFDTEEACRECYEHTREAVREVVTSHAAS